MGIRVLIFADDIGYENAHFPLTFVQMMACFAPSRASNDNYMSTYTMTFVKHLLLSISLTFHSY